MRKGMKISKALKKFSALALVLAMVFNMVAPTLADMPTRAANAVDYVALGDAISMGKGLDYPEDEAYYVLVAKALADAGLIEDEEDYKVYAKNKFRVEELRYLVDSDYAGDGYTSSLIGMGFLDNAKQAQTLIKDAKYITINAGAVNFSTYIVEQMMYYLENDGAAKYDFDFDDIFAEYDVSEDAQKTLEDAKNAVTDLLLAAANDEGDVAIELISYVAEVSTYALLSYVTSFNALVSSIYELNPDVDLYVVGIYNPAEGEKLTYTKDNGDVMTFEVGDYFGGLVELANSYAQVIAPRAYEYTYVEPGSPELFIDQLGDTTIANDYDRMPEGLMYELLELAGDAAVNEVIDIFAEYDNPKTFKEAEAFLEDLIEAKEQGKEKEFVQNELKNLVVDQIEDKFQQEVLNYLGQFAEEDQEIVTKQEIEDLLADLESAVDEAAREQVAADFVDALIEDEDLQNQAAAKVIHGYIKDYGLAGYVTVENVVDLIEALRACTTEAERETVANDWVRELAAIQIVNKVVGVVGECDFDKDIAIEMLKKMAEKDSEADRKAIAKSYLLENAFHDYMVAKVTESYGTNGLEISYYASFDAFVTAIETSNNPELVVRNEIRAAAAKKAANDQRMKDVFGDTITADDLLDMFDAVDAASNKQTAIKTWLNNLLTANGLGSIINFATLYNPMVDLFTEVYNAYVNAKDSSVNAVSKYLESVDAAAEACADFIEIQNSIVAEILEVYKDNIKADGKLDVGGFGDFDVLRGDAITKILTGYDDYVEAIDLAISSADTINEYLDPVYEMLMELAEIDTISLNHILSIAKKVVTGGQSYISDMVDNLLVEQTLSTEEKTIAYLALRYYLADGMLILPNANGHAELAENIIAAIVDGKKAPAEKGSLVDRIINKAIELYGLAKDFLKSPATGSGQVSTLINPEGYVAIGDNITSGTALGSDEKTYVDILADALAMEYNDVKDFDDDKVNNLAINGMRVDELWAILSDDYSGDDYTKAKLNITSALKKEYRDAIVNAELITIQIGINNIVTYPMTQALLAYNGEATYEMDWTQFFSEKNVNRVQKGKDMAMDLLLYLAKNADSQLKNEFGYSAYDEAEKALETMAVAIEAFAYGAISYVTYLDASVEKIAEMNQDATIVLVGFYNPLQDTYVEKDFTFTAKGKDFNVSIPKINTAAIAGAVVNQTNRYLTNYVGGKTAVDEDSRIAVVSAKNAELCISDTTASKNLAVMKNWKTVSVVGKDITIKVPEYLYETLATGGSALHPNATGHEYIAIQVLKALEYEIHADVIPDDDWKYYGDEDPEFTYSMDDESSLYDIVVELVRESGEDVGFYDIMASVLENNGKYDFDDGYYEIDCDIGQFEIKARPVTVNVVVENGKIISATTTDVVLNDEGIDVLNLEYAKGEVTYNNKNYDVTINLTVNDITPFTGIIARLDLESAVRIVLDVTVNDQYDNIDYSKMGILAWTEEESKTLKAEDAIYDENHVFSSEVVVGNNNKHHVYTEGIAAKEYNDLYTMRLYVELADGTYAYSPVFKYSVATYAYNMIKKHPGTELETLCVSLLNYGAAAQDYFDYREDNLANKNLSDEHKANAAMMDKVESYIDVLDSIDKNMFNFTGSTNEFKKTEAYLRLNGTTDITIKMFLDETIKENATSISLYYWTTEQYNNAVANGTKLELIDDQKVAFEDCDPTDNNGKNIMAVYSGQGTAAKDLGEGVYFCAVVETSDGDTYYRAPFVYSVETFAKNKLNSANLADLVKKMVVYGESAKAYFD